MSTVVIDNGSGFIKAGFSGDTAPKVIFPNIIGTPLESDKKDYFVGGEAQEKRSVLNLSHPVKRALIDSWDDMEKVWDHTYKALKVSPEDHPLLLSEVPLIPSDDREKMVQIMFEKFNVPSMSLGLTAVLSLYAVGRLEGMVVESGYGMTYIVPCTKGFLIPINVIRLEFAGDDLSNYLGRILNERGQSFSDAGTVNSIKEKLGYVALDYDKELKKPADKVEQTYDLPDETSISVGKERFQCPEALFNPKLAGVESSGIHTLVQESISKCDADLQKNMYANIVLSGGNMLFAGVEERMQKELEALAPKDAPVKLFSLPQADQKANSAWIGGSILAGHPGFQDLLITKKAYEETGPSIARKIE